MIVKDLAYGMTKIRPITCAWPKFEKTYLIWKSHGYDLQKVVSYQERHRGTQAPPPPPPKDAYSVILIVISLLRDLSGSDLVKEGRGG